jgi:hypothetical protein
MTRSRATHPNTAGFRQAQASQDSTSLRQAHKLERLRWRRRESNPRKIPAVFESGWCHSPDPEGRFAQRVARVGKREVGCRAEARPAECARC